MKRTILLSLMTIITLSTGLQGMLEYNYNDALALRNPRGQAPQVEHAALPTSPGFIGSHWGKILSLATVMAGSCGGLYVAHTVAPLIEDVSKDKVLYAGLALGAACTLPFLYAGNRLYAKYSDYRLLSSFKSFWKKEIEQNDFLETKDKVFFGGNPTADDQGNEYFTSEPIKSLSAYHSFKLAGSFPSINIQAILYTMDMYKKKFEEQFKSLELKTLYEMLEIEIVTVHKRVFESVCDQDIWIWAQREAAYKERLKDRISTSPRMLGKTEHDKEIALLYCSLRKAEKWLGYLQCCKEIYARYYGNQQ
jgi:hypothetical protein